jgi:hypothetical protein
MNNYGRISTCYSGVTVSTGENSSEVGGFAGKDWHGSYFECFWDSDTCPCVNGIGNLEDTNVVGKTTTEMQALGTFLDAGWDFVGEVVNGTEDIWAFLFADDYPRLRWENNPPVADAGDDREAYAWMDGFAEVTLDGSGSDDADDHELSYHWSWQIDSAVYQADGVNPTITLPAGVHTIELTVNDGIDDSQPDNVVITVVEPIQCDSRIAPRSIRRKSSMPKNIMVWLQLPPSINIDQISEDDPITLLEAELESTKLRIFQRGGSKANVNVFAYFDTADLLEAIDDTGRVNLTAVGNLTTGQYFFATDTIDIKGAGPNRRHHRKR